MLPQESKPYHHQFHKFLKEHPSILIDHKMNHFYIQESLDKLRFFHPFILQINPLRFTIQE